MGELPFDMSFDFDEAHDLIMSCQANFQAPGDLADAMVGAAGAALDSDSEEEVASPPPPKPESEMLWAVAVEEGAGEGAAGVYTEVPVVPAVPVVVAVPVVAAVPVAKAGCPKRKSSCTDVSAKTYLHWDRKNKKYFARISIKGKCKQRVVGRFDTKEEAHVAFAAALADVDAFMRKKKRGRKKGGKNRVK